MPSSLVVATESAIRMFYDDHPPPHFHAFYGDEAAVISIETGSK